MSSSSQNKAGSSINDVVKNHNNNSVHNTSSSAKSATKSTTTTTTTSTSTSIATGTFYVKYQDPFNYPPWKFNWLKTCCQWQGGIFQFFWLEWLGATAGCAAILTAVYFARLDDNITERREVTRGLVDGANFVARRFQAAIALMLGFYTIQCFTRWNEARKLEGAVMNKLNDLALQIAWKIKSPQSQQQQQQQRSKILGSQTFDETPPNSPAASSSSSSSQNNSDDPHDDVEKGSTTATTTTTTDTGLTPEFVGLQLFRWLNLSHAIVIGTVYQRDKSNGGAFTTTNQLVEYGLATPKEATFLRDQPPHIRHCAPFIWCLEFLEEVRDYQGGESFGVTDGVISSFCGGFAGLQTSLADLYNHKESPLPLCYRQLTNITVRTYMVILLLAAGLTETGNEPLGQLTKGSFWLIGVFAFEYFLFVGWLTVADAVHNPYREWPGAYRWDNFVISSHVNSLAIAHSFRRHEESKQLPEMNSPTAIEAVERKLKPRVLREWNNNHKFGNSIGRLSSSSSSSSKTTTRNPGHEKHHIRVLLLSNRKK